MDRDEVNWTRLLEWGAEHIAAERDLVELWLEESTSILSKVLPHFGIAWQHSWTYRRERRQSPRCQVSQTPSSSDDVYGPGLRTPTDNSDSSNTSRRVFVDIERLEPLLKAAVLSSDISLQTLDSTRGSGEVGDPTGSTLGTANASSNSEAEENTTAHEPSSAPHASLVKKTYTSERRLQLSLRHVLQNCRQHRWPAALVFVEIDKIPVDSQGVPDERFAKPLNRFHDLLNDLRHESDLLWQMNPIRWSILLQDCDRAEAVHQCRQHQEGIRDWSQDCAEQGRLALTASFGIAGIAQIPRNFDVNELLIRARRCLSGARLSGGDTLKSISV